MSYSCEINFKIINERYGLTIDISEEDVLIDKETGISEDKNNNIQFNIDYESNFENANLRLVMSRRDYSSVDSLGFNVVDLRDYVIDDLISTSIHETINDDNETSLVDSEYIYKISDHLSSNFVYNLTFKSDLVSGTYRLDFRLYDGDNYIGSVYKYIIIL